jgi:hypothetical protein
MSPLLQQNEQSVSLDVSAPTGSGNAHKIPQVRQNHGETMAAEGVPVGTGAPAPLLLNCAPLIDERTGLSLLLERVRREALEGRA